MLIIFSYFDLDENLSRITEDQFELLMDRLEKESYFQVEYQGYIFSQDIMFHDLLPLSLVLFKYLTN